MLLFGVSPIIQTPGVDIMNIVKLVQGKSKLMEGGIKLGFPLDRHYYYTRQYQQDYVQGGSYAHHTVV